MYVQFVRHFDPRSTLQVQTTFPLSAVVINEVLYRGPWQCDTPAQSPASTGQRCQTSCRGRLAPAWPKNGVIHPI